MIGSNCVLQINEKRIRARQYPWGIAEVENSDHCDFKILRDMLIRTHMQVCNGHHKVKWGHKRLTSILGPVCDLVLILVCPYFTKHLGSDRCYLSGSLRKLSGTKTVECYELKIDWKESNGTNGRRKEVFYSGHLGQWPSELVEFGHLGLGSP